MPPSEEEDQQALDKWIAAQPSPPTIWEVLESRNGRLFTAFVTRGFRQAAAEAAEETKRVERVREVVREAYGGIARRWRSFCGAVTLRWVATRRSSAQSVPKQGQKR